MKYVKKNSFIQLLCFTKNSRLKYFSGLFLSALVALFIQIIMSVFFKDMFNAFAYRNISAMITSLKSFGMVAFILFMVSPVCNYLTRSAVVEVIGHLRNTIYSHLQGLPIAFFKNEHSGDILSNLTNDIAETEKAYSQIFTKFSRQIVTGIGMTIYMFYLEWRISLLVIVTSVLSILINRYYAKKLRRVGLAIQEQLGVLTSGLSDMLAGMYVIRYFNLYSFISNKIRDKNSAVYSNAKSRVKIHSSLAFWTNITTSINIFGVTVLGSYMVIKDYISIGHVIAITQLQNGVIDLIQAIGSIFTEVQGSLAAVDRLSNVLNQEVEPITYSTEMSVDHQVALSLEKVTFGYNDKEIVLDQISLTVPYGKQYALVGASGGGKSSIIKLLLGFYPPISGNIVVAGSAISNQTLKSLREKVAYVPQNAYLFSGTIAENIGYGKKGSSREEIIQAAKIANAHDFISALEKGYDTIVGEKGVFLSGGQKQRIAIARAVIKDAPILLLDEATSALDGDSEQVVQDALTKLMANRTTLTITHRLATVQNADQILVLENGMIN